MLWWSVLPLGLRRAIWIFVAMLTDGLVPVGCYMIGRDIEDWTIPGLNGSASYRHAPGLAREVTPPSGVYWLYGGMAIAAAVTVWALFYYWFTQKESGGSTYG